MTTTQKIIFVFIVGTFLFAEIGFALAQAGGGLTPYNPFLYGIKRARNAQERQAGFLPEITQCAKVTNGVRSYDFGTCAIWLLNKVLAVVYTIALFVGVIYLVHAGVLYITSGGNATAIHGRVFYGVVGVVVAVISFSAVKAIEYSLTQGEAGFVAGGSTSGGDPVISGRPRVSVVGGNLTNNNSQAMLVLGVNPIDSCLGAVELTNARTGQTSSQGFGLPNQPNVTVSLPDQTQSGDRINGLLTVNEGDCEGSDFNFTIPASGSGQISLGGGGGPTGGGTSGARVTAPRLVVETDTVRSYQSAAGTYQLRFVAYVSPGTNQVNQCQATARVINVTRGLSNSENLTIDTEAKFMNVSTGLIQPGDNLRLYLSSRDCQAPSVISYVAPAEPFGVAMPTVELGEPRVLGQQTLTVQLPQNLEQAFIQALDIFIRQARLFDSPFYVTFRYRVVDARGQVPTASGNCALTFNLAGARVLSTRVNPIPATSIKFFNSIQTISIPIEPGRSNYAKTFPLGLSSNLIEVVKLRAIDLRGCQYRGAGGQTDISVSGSQGGWQYRVNVTAQ